MCRLFLWYFFFNLSHNIADVRVLHEFFRPLMLLRFGLNPCAVTELSDHSQKRRQFLFAQYAHLQGEMIAPVGLRHHPVLIDDDKYC